MRMWNLDVTKMCTQHLLGEHLEMHMFVGSINKGISMSGYIKNKLLEVDNLRKRHDEIVKELKERGINHKSELPKIRCFNGLNGEISVEENIQELRKRCPKCQI